MLNQRFTIEAIKDRLHLSNQGRSDRGLPNTDNDISQLVSYCEEMLTTFNIVLDLENTPMDMPTIDAMKEVANTVAKFKT